MGNSRKGVVGAVFVLIALILLVMASIIVMAPVSAQSGIATSERIIDTDSLVPGESTQITVAFTSLLDEAKAFALQEKIPAGWILTRVTDDASTFQEASNTWVWFSVGSADTKIITYDVRVPEDAAAGNYEISGILTAAKVSTSIRGDRIITVRGPGGDGIPEPTPTVGPTYTPGITPTPTVPPTATPEVTPTPTAPPEEEEGGIPGWGWFLIALAIIGSVVIVILMVSRMRGSS
ncbi:MAG: hypothetical protein JSV02_08120 [Dehalococcoidia bacterium]|nr:MAG: hypothetical protein JSV02_08120 [Dehalococcoidia bacterium]